MRPKKLHIGLYITRPILMVKIELIQFCLNAAAAAAASSCIFFFYGLIMTLFFHPLKVTVSKMMLKTRVLSAGCLFRKTETTSLVGRPVSVATSLAKLAPNCSSFCSTATTKQVRVGTHDGTFHCDAALACFLLRLTHKFSGALIVRTRDPHVPSQPTFSSLCYSFIFKLEYFFAF